MKDVLLELARYLPVLIVFGTPVAWVAVTRHFKLKEKELEAGRGADPKLLAANEQQRKLLEARIQNLETIVCSVDFELNQRLNQVAADASAQGRLLPPAPGESALPASRADKAYALGHLDQGQSVLGRYKIVREIGRGGMGAVYLAEDNKLNEQVALKVLSTAMTGDASQAAERFRREVQAARRVTHPNVIRIHDLGEDGPLLFLSMEYIEGDTLAARLKQQGPLPVREGVDVLADVALGVAAAHQAGVIHRDLKPQNVLLGRAARTVKVIDFGLATSTFFAGMSATGMILGTAEYMSPEQVKGQPCDARSDVYALGALAYHLFTGRPPFVGETPISIGFAHLSEAPEPPRKYRPDLSEELERVILRALEKQPAQRFADAGQLRKALVG